MKEFTEYAKEFLMEFGHPMSHEQAFKLGIKEAKREVAEGNYPGHLFTREQVNSWRSDVAMAAADIVRRALGIEPGWDWLYDAIEGMGTVLFEPRYASALFQPVVAESVELEVWYDTTPKDEPINVYIDKFGVYYRDDGQGRANILKSPVFWRYKDPKHVAKSVATLNHPE